MSAQYVLIATIVLLGLGFAAFAERGLQSRMRTFWLRRCSGRAWKRAFPQASKHELRSFLYLFVDSFAFPRSRALCFLPSDGVLAIYRTLYPRNDLPDVLEMETFAKQLNDEYGVSLNQIWSEELTLGQVFSTCRVPAA
jgi:hypothetical protein